MAMVMAGKSGDSPLLQVLSEAESTHSRRMRGDKASGSRSWPPEQLIAPLPAGKVVQPAVRADFIDLRRTLSSLAREELSGYVRLVADGVHCAALLSGGGVVAAICEADGEVAMGTEAFARMRRTVESGEGLVDIVSVPAVVLSALHLLIAGGAVYKGLRGKFLKGAEFIDYLSEQNLTGGVHVKSGGRHGVVLLHDGVLGAYTGRDPKPVDALEPVMELFDDPECEVWVNGGQAGATLPLMIL
ncbi:MAG: hypothetical protein QOK05_2535 [Chloroflexota bacterium]|jgi:hypothetical protein|nr:hypothetical protein [Chloroflexota bacterium]